MAEAQLWRTFAMESSAKCTSTGRRTGIAENRHRDFTHHHLPRHRFQIQHTTATMVAVYELFGQKYGQIPLLPPSDAMDANTV